MGIINSIRWQKIKPDARGEMLLARNIAFVPLSQVFVNSVGL